MRTIIKINDIGRKPKFKYTAIRIVYTARTSRGQKLFFFTQISTF